ncbi:MAG: cytochrome c3 family protein [Planctomycetota bacterium]
MRKDKQTSGLHHAGGGPPRPGAAVKRALLVLALVAGVLFYGGCSQTTRYRVLSFFFEGVPPPPGRKAAEQSKEKKEEEEREKEVATVFGVDIPADEARRRGLVRAERAAEERPAEPVAEEQPVFYHQPYRRRQCNQCHTKTAGYEVERIDASACARCHEAHFDRRSGDWVHGPVATGDCSICHQGHKAQHPDLLTRAQPDLCWRCHDRGRVLGAAYHESAAESSCARCHDPHFAGNRYLLADSRTYQRAGHTIRQVRSRHPDWEQDQCSRCHLPEKSLRVRQNADQQCLTCHQDQQEAPEGRSPHAPVTLGRCTACHAAHQSRLPHLVKPEAEKLCYACHNPDELRTPDHPRVRRANCLLCHRGHSSERENLLRPSIPASSDGGL